MTNNRILITALACLVVSPVLTVSAASSRNRTYSTVYAQQFKPTEKYSRGTLQGDFVWAADSSSLRIAAVRWKKFLLVYGERELDSAIQARLISIAKYELMRTYYLLGRLKAADEILKELDPLKLLNSTAAKDRAPGSVTVHLLPDRTIFSQARCLDAEEAATIPAFE